MHDIVRKTVLRPHLKFEHLDLGLLVAGELEVIKSNDICDDERWSRLDILTDLMCAAGFYEWSAVKRLYMAILTEVEMGVRNWGHSTSRLEQQILLPFPLKRSLTKGSESKSVSNSTSSSSSSGKGKGKGIWFCSAYQKKECSHTETHSADVNGKLLLAHHICG